MIAKKETKKINKFIVFKKEKSLNIGLSI